MKVKWSKHAHSQRMGIVRLIFREQTREIASKWNRDFGQTTRLLPPSTVLQWKSLSNPLELATGTQHDKTQQTLLSVQLPASPDQPVNATRQI